MTFEGALRTRLLESAAVMALVGRNPADEGASIDWTVRRQGSPLSAIVLETISDQLPQNHDGFDAVRPTRVQAKCLASTKTGAVGLRKAAIAALVPTGTFSGVFFERAAIDGVRDLSAQTDTGFIHCEAIDFIFRHNG